MSDPLVERLRLAGCVFAEEEAEILHSAELSAVQLESAVVRRVGGEPLEHIVGWVDFGGVRLSVGPGVFIPRQRSVRVAEAALAVARTQAGPVFVEAYAGVAPLAAFAVASGLDAEVHVTELEPDALEYAARNVPEAGRYIGSVLDGLPDSLRGRVSVVAAVPPYVPDGEVVLMPGEARNYEPERTHNGGPDGLDDVRRLLDEAVGWLRRDGVVLCELHRSQIDVAVDFATIAGFSTSATLDPDGQTATLQANKP